MTPTILDAMVDPKLFGTWFGGDRSEEHTSELQSLRHLVCRVLLEKNKRGAGLRRAGEDGGLGQAPGEQLGHDEGGAAPAYPRARGRGWDIDVGGSLVHEDTGQGGA